MRWGQVDIRQAAAALFLTTLSWAGGTIWTRYNAAEDQRRQNEATAAATVENRAEIARVAAKVERIEAAVDAQSRGQADFLNEIRAAMLHGVRPASGKRP